MKNKVSTFILIVFVSLILGLTIKGVPGNPTPTEIFQNLRGEAKPFELSPERGRYALTMSIVDNKSMYFTKDIAQFVLPDLGYVNGKFVSLFAPGVSFLAIPLYLIGKEFSLAQIATFSLSGIFAILNTTLIALIVKRISKNLFAGITSSLIFIFATVAWPYATSLYQHHITTFFILFSFFILSYKANVWTSFLVGALFGLSIFIEYPNAVFFIPILLLLVARHIATKEMRNKLVLQIYLPLFFGVLGFMITLIPTLWYNYEAYGSAFQLAGTVQTIRELKIDPRTDEVSIPHRQEKEGIPVGFFRLEKLPNSMTVLLISKDRGIVWFSPVILIGILGIYPLYKRRKAYGLVLATEVGIIFLLYGMWGDPWGGWAFGPRYLIPAIALLSILLGFAISKFSKKILFSMVFIVTAAYSTSVSLAGALTTIQIPPSVEIDSARYPKWVFLHNYELIFNDKSASFIYNEYFKNFIALKYYALIIFGTAIIAILISYKLSVKFINKK